jgi:hypothetical protein
MKYTRTMFIPKNARRVANIENLGVEIYAYETRQGKPAALAFHGRAQKPDWHYTFQSVEALKLKIKNFIAGYTAHSEMIQEIRGKRNQPTQLKIGDILYGSWGYDQTNIDYFQVTGRKGKRGVYVRPLAQITIPGSEGFMCENVIPDPNHFIGIETYHIAQKDSIAYNPSDKYLKPGQKPREERRYTAHLWDGKPDYQSHYA